MVWLTYRYDLVVGVALEPAGPADGLAGALVDGDRGGGAHEVLARLVVSEDHHGEGHRGEPVGEADVARAEGGAEHRPVGEPGSEERLEEETEVHRLVAHALLADREPARLADEEVRPLDDDDAHP